MKNIKQKTTYIGEIVVCEKFVTEENKHEKRINGRPFYWKCPFEITAPNIEQAKNMLLMRGFYKEFPTTIFVINMIVKKKIVSEYLLDYLHGICHLLNTTVKKVEG